MNIDLSITRMAFREAPTLAEGQLLVASKRAELEHDLTLKRLSEGAPATRDDVERTVGEMEKASELKVAASSHAVDKVA